MKRYLAGLLPVLVAASFAVAGEYAPGQVWKYKTRPGEEGSRIYIVKVDQEKEFGAIYHIYVDKLKLKNPKLKTGFQEELPHAPVSKKSLDESVKELAGTSEKMPDINEGYKMWRKSFEAGEGGVLDLPVADIIGLSEHLVTPQHEEHHKQEEGNKK